MVEGKVLAILQARMSSTRLPGKVLKPILGRPMLARQLERLSRCRSLDRLVVATSDRSDDDPIADVCDAEDIAVFRGSLNDVLDRFYKCAQQQDDKPMVVVRLTADCPLADPTLIDNVVATFQESNFDYVSNCDPPTYPDGLDVEVFSLRALATAWREAVLPSHREHVTPFIRKQPERFSVGNYAAEIDRSHMRWTVDEFEDYKFVCRVFELLYPVNPAFGIDDVLGILADMPELADLNSQFSRSEGSKKSLIADVNFLSNAANGK